MDVVDRLLELGGVARRSELVGSAADRRTLAAAVTQGTVRDLGGGWVAAVDADPAVVAARRFNGTITCVSAAPFYGLQQLRAPQRVHMAVPRVRGARPDPRRREIVVHRESSWTRSPGLGLPLAPLVEVLARALRCLPEDEAATMVDSALKRRLISVEEIDRTLGGPGSVRARTALQRCDGRSRSAIETTARLALRAAGYDVEAGVPIPGVGEVDLVVAGRVVVECDGFSYHSGRHEYREDRRRDRALAALGYVTLRFTWEDVMNDPGVVVAAVRAVLDRGRVVGGGPQAS